LIHAARVPGFIMGDLAVSLRTRAFERRLVCNTVVGPSLVARRGIVAGAAGAALELWARLLPILDRVGSAVP
jgi:hypothetical protein